MYQLSGMQIIRKKLHKLHLSNINYIYLKLILKWKQKVKTETYCDFIGMQSSGALFPKHLLKRLDGFCFDFSSTPPLYF